MGEAQGEGAIVAQQQGAPAVAIKAPHRMESGASGQLGGEKVEHGGAAPGIVAGA
jgi:hypothetical protein